jgi:hypothetical protein
MKALCLHTRLYERALYFNGLETPRVRSRKHRIPCRGSSVGWWNCFWQATGSGRPYCLGGIVLRLGLFTIRILHHHSVVDMDAVVLILYTALGHVHGNTGARVAGRLRLLLQPEVLLGNSLKDRLGL